MLHIPILRHGKPYESVDKIQIVHHATGEPVAEVSMANSGLISRDVHRIDDGILEQFTVKELIGMCKKAADIFLNGVISIGETPQSFENYVKHLSSTTGMPHSYCRGNAKKIHRVLDEMDVILAGLTRGFDLTILDRGWGDDDGRTLSYYREGRVFGAVLPSNSPGVHSLWAPAVALKAPIVLKPGREEPWTPFRMIQSFIGAGMPAEAFGFYPTDHGGSSTLLQVVDRAMLFGDASIAKMWAKDSRVEVHGPGWSKVILGDDAAENWEKYVDLMVGSIAANGGRSCINASGIWTPKNGDKIAEALAQKLATVKALPADHPDAQIAAFANPQMAVRMNTFHRRPDARRVPMSRKSCAARHALCNKAGLRGFCRRLCDAIGTTRWRTRNISSPLRPSLNARPAKCLTRSAIRLSAPCSPTIPNSAAP